MYDPLRFLHKVEIGKQSTIDYPSALVGMTIQKRYFENAPLEICDLMMREIWF